ncbi:hypothetical protein H4R33_003395 [Dimargaris cristalligena]|uniref:Uncharacterized protein n=1 Tax=Dimargaris cristalligena TaxID=215637 RepID=A0A4P9ZY70_9FUNG|nr:hypothetical protein H4R33_003395 [Dimargaris cristalligena]RKP38654.1 hypothetical protein BJ085DRAFT_32566 [Dimargaris cristalligena]|eukprot:RKP38654.1 hypothetical protein BJ085DRAFT_32566 [Dimargaris cristalligena]
MIGAKYRSPHRKAKMHRQYTSCVTSRPGSSVSSVRTYDLNRSSVSSICQRSRLERIVRVVQGVFVKPKHSSRSRRLNHEKLKHVQDLVADTKCQMAADKKATAATYLTDYAPFYVLKLITVIFADELACLKLEKAETMTWGIRTRDVADFIPLQTARDKFKDNVRKPYGGNLTGERLTPKAYLSRVVQECWLAIIAAAQASDTSPTATNAANKSRRSFCGIGRSDARYPKQDARWFLRQYCIIYGFAAVKLHMPNALMAGPLVQIAALPTLSEYSSQNEDSLYALELGVSFMAQIQQHLPTKLSVVTLQDSANLTSTGGAVLEEGKATLRRGSVSSHARSASYTKRRMAPRPPRQSHLSFLYPTPVPTVFTAMLTDPDPPNGPNAALLVTPKSKTVDPSLLVGTEIILMNMVELLTRPSLPHTLTPAAVFPVVHTLPRMLQTPPPLSLFEELQVSFDYLLSSDVPDYMLQLSSHWFRESADHRKLRLMNELGFEEYFERLSTETDRQSQVLMLPPPPHRNSSTTTFDDPMMIRLTPNRNSCPVPAKSTNALVSSPSRPREYPDLYAAYCRTVDYAAAPASPVPRPRPSSRCTNDSHFTEGSEYTRVPPSTDEDPWKPAALASSPFLGQTPRSPLSPRTPGGSGLGGGIGGITSASFSSISLPNLKSPVRTNLTLVASHIKHCIQQLPDGLIPDSVMIALMQLLPELPVDMRSTPGLVVGSPSFEWTPSPAEITLIRGLLALSPWRFYLLQQIVHMAQLILVHGTKDPISPFGLAVVLPVYEASTSMCLKDLEMLRRWNWCWGCLLSRGEELFLNSHPPLVSEKDRNGFGYTMYLHKHG